jgi:hypothetical protein
MALYRVREGYVVHLENSKTLSQGAVFEPDQKVLDSQGWKIEPVKEVEPLPEKPNPVTKEVEAPPQDRMIKKPPVKK